MRRLLRILLNAATVLSLLAFAGVVWLCQTGEIVYWGWRNRNCVFAMYGTLVVRVGEWGSGVASVMALFLTIVVPTLHLEVYHRRWAKARMRPAGLCPACGYDCRATPDRCPECGASGGDVRRVGGGLLKVLTVPSWPGGVIVRAVRLSGCFWCTASGALIGAAGHGEQARPLF